MGAPAKKSQRRHDEETPSASPATSLRAELCDASKKAAKAGQIDDAIYHYLAVFIHDASMDSAANQVADRDANSTPTTFKQEADPEILGQIRKFAKKKYGDVNTKLWIAFADLHQEMLTLLAPITKPIDLGTGLQSLKDALAGLKSIKTWDGSK